MIMQSVSSGESIDSVEEDIGHSFDSGSGDNDLNIEHKSSESSRMMSMNSPTDVRSYRDRDRDRDQHMDHHYYEDTEDAFNTSLTMMGDPLPIVREGSILDDNYEDMQNNGGYGHSTDDEVADVDDDDVITEDFLEYQREQEEFRREMNRTKIAFASYRGAVLHLVHNQESFTKKGHSSSSNSNSTGNQEDGDQDAGGETNENHNDDSSEYGSSVNQDDSDTINTEDEANKRMTRLEEMARDIVETKAKACFEAVEVVKQFESMREEKRQRRRMLLGGLAGVGGQDNVLAELRKMKRKKAEITSNSANRSWSSTATTESTNNKASSVISEPKETEKKPEPKKVQPPKAKKNNNHSQHSMQKKSPPVGPIVRLKKKPARHPDCIKETLPKFKFQQDEGEPDHGTGNNDDGSFTPAKYRTTKWIKNMVKWRIEKRKHEEAALTKCGCDDCSAELKRLYENDKKKSSFMKQ